MYLFHDLNALHPTLQMETTYHSYAHVEHRIDRQHYKWKQHATVMLMEHPIDSQHYKGKQHATVMLMEYELSLGIPYQ